MNTTERKQLIESYGKSCDFFEDALEQFPEKMWHYRPAPGKWSIHETIIHLADSEANSYIRCRRFIAEPGLGVMAYDQDAWAIKLDYHRQNTEDAIILLRLLRKMSYDLIKDLPDSVWKNTIDHPENGTMTFDLWLKIYEDHVQSHVRQMHRIYEAWKKEKTPVK